MKQKYANLLKSVDVIVGTPIAYLLSAFKTKNTMPDRIQRILVIKLIGMGDVILTLPTIEAIKESYPRADIDYLTTKRSEFPLRGTSLVRDIIEFKFNPLKLIGLVSLIRNHDYDLVIDMEQRYRLPTIVAFLARPKWMIGFRVSGQGRNMLFDDGTSYPAIGHESGKFAQLLSCMGISLQVKDQLPRLQFKARSAWDDLEFDTKPYRVVFHVSVGPAQEKRTISFEQWMKVYDQISKLSPTVIVTGIEKDQFLAERLKNEIPNCINTAGRLSIEELFTTFQGADLVVSGDTGPLHLAAASGVKTIGIYNIPNSNQWGPYGKNCYAIRANEIESIAGILAQS